ncbi:transposase [Chryseobacterium cucumeris]|uniref:transposase n=1 Tax=Chryseobacterium TaxID=59732 RepID=UPI0028833627|nr:transposase [Chryseobacterium sp. SG20098]WNI36436.1 transposase [Chryseobacterium sp. SG20098]
MTVDIKKIHIGNCIQQQIQSLDIEMERIVRFLNISESEVTSILSSENIDTHLLLRFSKLLEYDFFRLYSQHLILYSPQRNINYNVKKNKTSLPVYRKNIYTREVIDFIINLIISEKKTKTQIIQDYNIPKSTLNKWIFKYTKHD